MRTAPSSTPAGGLQELHIDQGGMPLPYPPFPFGSLIIWCYSDFSLAAGGTYVVPGSHRFAGGATRFHEGADLVGLVDGEPGLVAICAPPGTCIITDTRVLHCGGPHTAAGTRYANALSLQPPLHAGFARAGVRQPPRTRRRLRASIAAAQTDDEHRPTTTIGRSGSCAAMPRSSHHSYSMF